MDCKSTPTPIITEDRIAVTWLKSIPTHPINPKFNITADNKGVTAITPQIILLKKILAMKAINSIEAKILINEETKKIERITVNFAHNNSTQIKVLRKLINYDAFHVGINSTDIYYNLNGKATQPTGLNRVIDE